MIKNRESTIKNIEGMSKRMKYHLLDTALAAARLNSPEGDGIRAQSPLNRVATPEEVAHAVFFLASEGAEFSTGTIIDVNGASYLRT